MRHILISLLGVWISWWNTDSCVWCITWRTFVARGDSSTCRLPIAKNSKYVINVGCCCCVFGGLWGIDITLFIILNKCQGMITDLFIDKFKFKVRILCKIILLVNCTADIPFLGFVVALRQQSLAEWWFSFFSLPACSVLHWFFRRNKILILWIYFRGWMWRTRSLSYWRCSTTMTCRILWTFLTEHNETYYSQIHCESITPSLLTKQKKIQLNFH